MSSINKENMRFMILRISTISAAVAALFLTCGVAFAQLPSSYLSGGFEGLRFDKEKAFISLGIINDSGGANGFSSVNLTNECELLETSEKTGIKVGPFPGSGRYAKEVVPALVSSPEMIDSARLRTIARNVKYNLISASGNKTYADYYKGYVNSPIALFIGFKYGTGLSCSPQPLFLPLAGGGHYFFNSVIFVEDTPGFLDVADSIANDTFDLVMAHENAHGIMIDMYGSRMKDLDMKKRSNYGHDSPVISDRNLAYIEGWAEAFEALYGPANPLLKLREAERKKYRLSEFLFTRQDPVRRDAYVWQTREKNGLLKNANQLIATEGVIAGQFYDILTSRALTDSFVKCVTLMYEYRPSDFVEFIKCWAKRYPEDQRTIYRIFLENTLYSTMSNDARQMYHNYYNAKLKFMKKQLAEAEFHVIKNKWYAFKEELFKRAIETGAIDSSVGPDLWMKITRHPSDPGFKTLHLNLASVSARSLGKIMPDLTPADVDSIIKVRESAGRLDYPDATSALKALLGGEKASTVINNGGISDIK